MVILLCWFGTISTVMSAIIPSVAFLPILLYIGMLIGSQAFQETPKRHAPAIILAIVPSMANWGMTVINSSLAAAGIQNVSDQLATGMLDQGVYYRGLQILGGGSTLGGLILGATAVCIIDHKLFKAAGFALAGAILAFFGLMHGEQVGIAQSPRVAAAYLAGRHHRAPGRLRKICRARATRRRPGTRGGTQRGIGGLVSTLVSRLSAVLGAWDGPSGFVVRQVDRRQNPIAPPTIAKQSYVSKLACRDPCYCNEITTIGVCAPPTEA